jgi:PHD/YefM family antitoxin component YafN of YafNO toxin-antitoxin module
MKERAMIELHPEILRKDGKNEFVVLPYEEYEALTELLEEAEDLLELRRARAEDAGGPGLSVREAAKELGLDKP